MNARPDLALRRGELMEKIRQAAIEEFAENGLRGASTQAIARRAGISKTKLHYYIASKEELYQEALTHIIGIWAELFNDVVDDEDPQSFLRRYIARKIRHSLEHPEVARMFTNEVMRGAPMMREYWDTSRHATQKASERIESWVADGLIRPVDPFLLQFNIWALTQHYALHLPEVRFMLGVDEGQPLDAEHIIDEVTALVFHGLRP
ncbi:MAG: TetR family transcriptional regulator C-terminal domain-containing protein [Gemmobacter sp.]|nr:TetR family transcriptional regulator C-terminal domain-containing protein [Gemmobacter sp.]